MVTAVPVTVAAPVGHIVVFGVEADLFGSAAVAQTVETALHDLAGAASALLSEEVDVVFASALAVDVVAADETVAVFVPPGAVFALGALDVVTVAVAVALSAVSAESVVQSPLPADSVAELVEYAAAM